jgi:hypothetical protein
VRPMSAIAIIPDLELMATAIGSTNSWPSVRPPTSHSWLRSSGRSASHSLPTIVLPRGNAGHHAGRACSAHANENPAARTEAAAMSLDELGMPSSSEPSARLHCSMP